MCMCMCVYVCVHVCVCVCVCMCVCVTHTRTHVDLVSSVDVVLLPFHYHVELLWVRVCAGVCMWGEGWG